MRYSISQVHKCHLPMSNPCEEYNRSDYCVKSIFQVPIVIFLFPIPVKNTTGVTIELLFIPVLQMSLFFVQSL